MISDELLDELKQIKSLLSLNKQILTMDEFCLYTGLAKQQAYKLTSQRKIKFSKPLGKMIYFDIEDVIEFLKSNCVTTGKTLQQKASNYSLVKK